MERISAGIIGAGGYAGAELLRLLLKHPFVNLAGVAARSSPGQEICTLYPGLRKNADFMPESEDRVIEKSDIVFAALPHGLSERIARKCIDGRKKLIDIGSDFRLRNEADCIQWYGQSYQYKDLHKKAVYGLCEIKRSQIVSADIITNPGCYPTSVLLGLYPALKYGIAQVKHIIIDSKSGLTGAGKTLAAAAHFSRANEACAPYKIGGHRHTPEIEQMLSDFAREEVKTTFVPHLLPVNRGIVSTMYVPLRKKMEFAKIHALYVDAFADDFFIRVLPAGDIADLKFVTYSNYCDISVHLDGRTDTLIVVSCIDNMIKGAAGQAIQNMNIMCGMPEEIGIDMIPPSF